MRFALIISVLLLILNTAVDGNEIAPVSPDSGGTGAPDRWAYEILHIVAQKAAKGSVVKVAVVDDGFRLTHKALKDFIFTNKREIPGNFQDDDQNGLTDDIHGWDVSDGDSDVSVPKGKEDIYFHGTYIAGIITTVFQEYFGADASKYLEIIPVKVLSNQAQNTYLADGYKGLRYACEIGADIICCAWSGGTISDDDKAVVNKAIQNGTLIIGSAGNFYTEKAELPSSLPGVICVAAVDSLLRKSQASNFGIRIDLSAPGTEVFGPFPAADNSFVFENGTSPSAAIIAGCMAILKSLRPDLPSVDLVDVIRNTATPVDSMNLYYCGKMGAGIPDMGRAIDFILNPGLKYTCFNPSRTEGKIWYQKRKSPKKWEIRPPGAFSGIHFYSGSADYKGKLKIISNDSVCYSGPIGGIARGEYIPGSSITVELQPKSRLPRNLEFSYYVETIDSTTLYCRDLQEIEAESGSVTDNSGEADYANNSSCKWQLKVPEGKKIRIEFDEFNTQAKVDFVWIFDGTAPLQEKIIAKFSGSSKPPVITTLTNQVLIWFLTDGATTGKGWKLNFKSVE